MTQIISSIIESAKARLMQEVAQNKTTRRIYFDCTLTDFTQLLSIECSRIMAKRTDNPVFDLDGINKPIIEILWKYLSGKEFEGSHDRGILLAGAIGCGKTVLLKGFCNIIPQVSNKNITCVHSIELAALIRKNGILEEYVRKPMFIDDIGKEQESVKDFGTDVRPIIDLIPQRYDAGSWTFCTTNYNLNSLKEKYTPHTADRLIEMFNFYVLTGESRRK
jgi:DNA replication protein DnaC